MPDGEPGYPEVNVENYVRLQRDLARPGEKGSDHQVEFLAAAAEDTDSFLALLQGKGISLSDEVSRVAVYDRPLTEQSFREMPAGEEAALYDAWSHVPPRIACRQPFWAHVVLQHLRWGKLGHPTWLALNGQARETGAVRVEHALKTRSDAEIDACTRSILRRLAGLRTVRGQRSLFSDAPFARAWWRVHTVRRIGEGYSPAELKPLHAVLRTSQEYWERIVSMIVSRASVYGSLEVQGALITGLAAHAANRPDTNVLTVSVLTTLLRRISNIAASIELAALESDELAVIVREEVSRVDASGSG